MDFMDNLPQVYMYHFMKTVMLTAFEWGDLNVYYKFEVLIVTSLF